ncbi:hypothetical protein E0L35_15440 [Halomonas sp. ATBC28]|uniref:DUF5677 domain-containing protein n=1 Tax=Halomonas sp. ATBC28 TaxID=2545264 RepID=UPI00110D984C|nr:DUF5677 domain-containing protein [Halomonas sp. ATBC28]TMU22857.1 hypothetical protein E0L35_15440 [Halomonas sp. ATBC28]
MPRFEPETHEPVEAYTEAMEAIHVAVGIALFEFARNSSAQQDTVIRNFLARADTTARAVFKLWDIHDYQDCWVLHRCLLDRLFHLRYLARTDSFSEFEEWSFYEQYKGVNRVRSDQSVKGVREHPLFNLTVEQKRRAQNISEAASKWRRPKAEDIAKEMGLTFLYSYGYDYASTHVHPMAHDGDQDFYTITGLESQQEFPDQRTVLANTLLVLTILVQEAMNSSTFQWRQIMYRVIEDVRKFVGNGDYSYRQSFVIFVNAVQEGMSMSEVNDIAQEASKI